MGFRWFVHEQATALSFAGWVCNTSAGHVEIVAEGDSDGIARLVALVSRGPRGARVDAVHHLPVPEGEPMSAPFRIEQTRQESPE